MDDARIRILPLGGQWETLGSDRLRGIVPTGIEASSDSWGPSEMHFQLAAEAGARRPDVLPFTPVELEVGGILVWSGFVWQRPSDANSYSVGCRGWQFHLDDELHQKSYVHTRVSDYRDARTFLTENLATFHAGGQVATDGGTTLIGWPNGAVLPAGGCVGVTLDLGPGSAAKRVVMTWESTNNAGTINCICRATDAEDSGNATFSAGFTFALNTGATGTSTGTFGTARRYVHVFLNFAGGGGLAADIHVRIKSIQVFADTAYESGNASILKADTVIKDVLAVHAPLLSQSTSLITAGTFSLPEYGTTYASPRSIMEAVNAVEFYRLKVGGETLKQLVYDPKPSSPIAEVGDWSGSQFDDATVTGEPIYDVAVLDGTGPDGGRLVSVRTQTGTLVDRRGFHRASKVEVSAAVTQAVADRICDLWLTEHKTAPFSGTLRIIGSGARRVLSGGSIPPQEFLLYSGEKIRLANRVDPDTGSQARDGRIAGSTYRHDDRSVEIAIDDQRTRFDTTLARYAALVGG